MNTIDAFLKEICQDEERILQRKQNPEVQKVAGASSLAPEEEEEVPQSLMKNIFANYVV